MVSSGVPPAGPQLAPPQRKRHGHRGRPAPTRRPTAPMSGHTPSTAGSPPPPAEPRSSGPGNRWAARWQTHWSAGRPCSA